MTDIIEEIYQGYCRTLDQARTVTCEFRMEGSEKILDYVDCSYGKCVHSKTCNLLAAVRENKVENSTI